MSRFAIKGFCLFFTNSFNMIFVLELFPHPNGENIPPERDKPPICMGVSFFY